MTIKSLTITEEAYTALKTIKHGDESFSEVIVRISKEKIGLTAKFFGALKINEKEAKEIEHNFKRRREIIEKESFLKTKKIREQFS